MKLFTAIFCETILLIMVAQQSDIEDIIKDFVALGFIVEVDNVFNVLDFFEKQNEALVDEMNETLKFDFE